MNTEIKSIKILFGSRMFIKKSNLIILFSLFFLSNCAKSPLSEFKFYRLIDNLNKENILHSPLIQVPQKTEESHKVFPLKSYPISDLGSGDNPFGIKRKLKLAREEINVLFSPPKSKFTFNLNIPENSVLEFGIGTIRDENSEELIKSSGNEERGTTFIVSIETKGRKKTIYQKHIPFPTKDEKHFFYKYCVDIPHAQENVEMSLVTEGGENNFSFWYNPVLYKKEKSLRNVILISIDTLRADHLGCYGYDRNTSPNIDSLASDSTMFLNTYASSPWTLPSHISLLTSLHGVHHQVYYDREKMDPSILTLADTLRQNYFLCSSFTGGGFVSSVYGFSKGFDTYRDGVGGVFQQNSAELLFRAVSEWLDKEKNKNFFLFLHTYQTHNPYACPYPYKTMFLKEGAKWRHIDLVNYLGGKPGVFKKVTEGERQNIIGLYDGEIRYTDEKLIGPLIGKLKEMELFDQTMIIFTSDHGEEFYDHMGWGHGHSLYDESLKVPLVIKFPGSKFKGKEIGDIVSLVDVMPTILEEMGIDFSDLSIDGRSLSPLIKGKERGDRTFLADIGSDVLNSRIPQKISMNIGKNKLILNKRFSSKDLDFFLYPPPVLIPVELYDLKQDLLEIKNTADEKAVLVNQIIRQINEIYTKAKKRKTSRPEPEIDEKLKEQLKALGYIH